MAAANAKRPHTAESANHCRKSGIIRSISAAARWQIPFCAARVVWRQSSPSMMASAMSDASSIARLTPSLGEPQRDRHRNQGDYHAIPHARKNRDQGQPYALGAMVFGKLGKPDHEESIRIIHKALDAGINFIDTADRYSSGESEEIVGKALKGKRDNVVLATKVFGPMGTAPTSRAARAAGSYPRRFALPVADRPYRSLSDPPSLTRYRYRGTPLGDDRPDAGRQGACYRPVYLSLIEEVEAQWVDEHRNPLPRRTAALFDPGSRHRTRHAAHLPALRHGVLVWSPLSKGMLTGRYGKGQPLPDSLRVKFMTRQMSDERSLSAVEQLIPLAERRACRSPTWRWHS